MGRPIKKSFFGNTASSGEQIQVTAWIPGDTSPKTGYILAQRGSRSYLVHTAAGNGICYLGNVTTPAAAGMMSALVYPYGSASGSGATAGTVTMKLVSATVGSTPGTGYAAGNVVTVAGGTATTAANIVVGTVDGNGNVLTVTLSNVGNYTVLPTLTDNGVTGGSGSGLRINLSFGVRSVPVTAGGSDYIVAPNVTLTGGSPSPAAVVTSTIANGSVTGTTVTTVGAGFTVTPTAAFVVAGSGSVEHAEKITAHRVVTYEGNVYTPWALQGGNITTGGAQIQSL